MKQPCMWEESMHYEIQRRSLADLLTIMFAALTQLFERSPKTLMKVRHEVPLEILVHEAHTGAYRWRAPATDCAAIIMANLV